MRPAAFVQIPDTMLPAEYRLSDLMRRELGVSINDKALRVFIRAHWKKVSMLAHAIHDADGGVESDG